jgi:3-hydroxyacyl-CoA dehydrogenase
VHLNTIADSARDVDFAMRWGFGVKQGPFELWQEAGWKQVAQWIQEDIDAGKALCKAPLPAWVFDGRDGVHSAEGSWNPTQGRYQPLSALPVYQRQHFRENVLGAARLDPATAGKTLAEDESMRLWTLDDEVHHRQHQDQGACHRPGRDRRPAEGHRAGRNRLQGPGDLVG